MYIPQDLSHLFLKVICKERGVLAIAIKTQLLKPGGLWGMSGCSVWEMSCHVMPTPSLHFPTLLQAAWFFVRCKEDKGFKFKIYQYFTNTTLSHKQIMYFSYVTQL